MKMLGFDATRGWYELPHATEAYVQRNSRWPHPAVAVCLDKDLANGAWLSGNSRALIEEIATFLERRGVSTTFVRERPSSHFTAQHLAGRWRGFRSISRRSANRASGMAEDGSVLTETLEVLGDSMPLYAAWLSKSVAPNSYEKILEIGAGTGTMSALLSSKGSVVAYEPAGTAFEVLANNFSGSNTVTVCSTLDEMRDLGPFSLIVLVNVLEHIDADVAFLSTIQPLLATNGELVIFSPAHNVLYSRFDAAIGHVRRYTTRQMRRTLVAAGFKPVEIRYFNSLGAIMWLIVNRLLRVSSASGGSTKLYDRLVVPLSIALDRIPIRPFGQSVLARSTHGNHD